ncbi:MAG: hypothetical protein KKD44_28500, partial [Proteobacteria bacterium]|nr:hypothetical protein [Pseudomonadota bacterium]
MNSLRDRLQDVPGGVQGLAEQQRADKREAREEALAESLTPTMQMAVSALKAQPGEESGEFRGGDPEELQRKREEKRTDLEDTGELDAVDKAVAILKAEPGSEGGEFRGGDPEELQRKREEKREEAAESGEGELQEEEAALEVEAQGGESAMEEQAAEAAEEEAAKSINPLSSSEVSPVDTGGDYQPRGWNGDPFTLHNQAVEPERIDPAPVRDEKTKHLPWSEVLGFKVPKEGAPWAYLRRFIFSGESDKIPEESAKILKAFDAAEDPFFELYKNLNRDLTFDPEYRISKGGYEKGSIVPGHKYVYRQKDKNGKWQYTYTDGVHIDHHGVQDTGISGGHTVEVHPDWHGKDVSTGQDPQLKDPEAAFHFTRQKALEEGGNHRIWIKNKDKWNPELGESDDSGKPVGDYEKEAHILHIPGVSTKGRSAGQLLGRGKLQLHKDPTGGQGDISNFVPPKDGSGKKWDKWEQLEEHVRRQHVNTIHDIHGKPFVQYYESMSRAKPGKLEATRPRGEESKGEKGKPLR